MCLHARQWGGPLGCGKQSKVVEVRMTSHVSRRSLLALGAGVATGLGTSLFSGHAIAKAPKLGTQSPYYHRFIVGSSEVTVVSDGPLPLGDPSGAFVGVPRDDVQKMLTDNFLSGSNIVLEQNAPIVNMNDKLVLFDTGMGTSRLFGPTTGRLQKSIAESGTGRRISTQSSVRMPTSIISAAWWMPITDCCFRMRRFISARRTSRSGPTKASLVRR
jgi:hypothetical protein